MSLESFLNVLEITQCLKEHVDALTLVHFSIMSAKHLLKLFLVILIPEFVRIEASVWLNFLLSNNHLQYFVMGDFIRNVFCSYFFHILYLLNTRLKDMFFL